MLQELWQDPHGMPPFRDCTFLLKWGKAPDGTSVHWKAVKLFSSYREQFGLLWAAQELAEPVLCKMTLPGHVWCSGNQSQCLQRKHWSHNLYMISQVLEFYSDSYYEQKRTRIHMQKLTDESALPIPFISVVRSNALWTERNTGQHGKHFILKSKEIFLKGSDVKMRKKWTNKKLRVNEPTTS